MKFLLTSLVTILFLNSYSQECGFIPPDEPVNIMGFTENPYDTVPICRDIRAITYVLYTDSINEVTQNDVDSMYLLANEAFDGNLIFHNTETQYWNLTDSLDYNEWGMTYSTDTSQWGSPNELTIKSWMTESNDEYLKVWVVNAINGAFAGTGGVVGFAYFPGAYDPVDGVVIRYDVGGVRTNPSFGAQTGDPYHVFAHEIGHWLRLYHTFQNTGSECPPEDDCFVQGDRVCDTPPQIGYFGCAVQDCNPEPNNVMSYNACKVDFTEGQYHRMYDALNNWRPDVCICTSCFGDYNGDGIVNTEDKLAFLSAYGYECEGMDCCFDIDGDGFIGTADLLEFLSIFGESCN